MNQKLSLQQERLGQPYPEECADSERGQAVGRSCQQRRGVSEEHVCFQQAQLRYVLESDGNCQTTKPRNPQWLSPAHHGQVVCEGARRLDGREQGEKLAAGGGRQPVPQRLQDEQLHVHQLAPGVGVVSGVHKVVQLRRVDLLVFPEASMTSPIGTFLNRAAESNL